MQDLDQFNQECLRAHNELRKVHKVPELVYDRNLAVEAAKYAKSIAEKQKLTHSEDRNNVGENLAQSTKDFVNYVFSGLGATVLWYSEVKDYDFDQEKQTKTTGHFTQVVWKETEKAGFGRAKNSANNTWYVVGRYFPAGNMSRSFKRNVLPLPKNLKWEDVTMVKEYLEELRTWEFTRGRRNILDSYSRSLTSPKNNNFYLIKENFKPQNGEMYSESQMYQQDVTKEPRPIFFSQKSEQLEKTPKTKITKEDKKISQDRKVSDDDNVFNSFSPSPPKKENNKFVKSLLDRHNHYRKIHRVGTLDLDEELSKFAEKWAKTLSKDGRLGYSNIQYKGLEIGENIVIKNAPLNIESGTQVVDSWYNEHKFFSHAELSEDIRNFGHFTQMVWKETKSIGIGVSTNSIGFNFIVCFYYPPGNIRNEFDKMVPHANI